MHKDYNNIRSYIDSEIQNVFKRLLSNEDLMRGAKAAMPISAIEDFKKNHHSIKDIDTFQLLYMMPTIENLSKIKRTKITSSGIENISTPALFLSNHRDIIIDPAFLQYVLMSNGLKTTEIGIGNNLAAKPWILDAMRINKSFIVRRNLKKEEMFSAFAELSGYIRSVIEDNNFVWLAQREGRAKDSNDTTQVSLLKMLALSGKGDFIDNIKSLNITPLSISYEYDACDYLKAKELQQKRDNPNFEKLATDDMISMQTGVFGYTSEIHYSFAKNINAELDNVSSMQLSRNEQIQATANIIDKYIYQNYNIYKSNYIAFDILNKEGQFMKFYNADDKNKFEEYIDKQVSKINLSDIDKEFCTNKILEMYANPLKNKILSSK